MGYDANDLWAYSMDTATATNAFDVQRVQSVE